MSRTLLRVRLFGALLLLCAQPAVGQPILVRHDHLARRLAFTQAKATSNIGLKAENWSKQIEPGWWEWGIRLKGSASMLDRVRCVEYTLHRSFPNPVRTVCTRQNNFELKTSGWGTFTVQIKVYFQDKTTQTLSHELRFTP
jgi:hypothetical protein